MDSSSSGSTTDAADEEAGRPLAQRGQVSSRVFHSLVRRLNRLSRMAGWRGQLPSEDMVIFLVLLCCLWKYIIVGASEGTIHVLSLSLSVC